MSKMLPGLIALPGSSTANHTGSWGTEHPRFLLEKCTSCDLCVVYCPEGIVVKLGKKNYEFDADYCKGCGICAEECPVNDIVMEAEAR